MTLLFSSCGSALLLLLHVVVLQYYLTALVADNRCMYDARGDANRCSQRLQLCRMSLFLPCFCIWLLVGTSYLVTNTLENSLCYFFVLPLYFEEELVVPWLFFVIFYIIVRSITLCLTCWTLGIQCGALYATSVRPISVELTKVPREQRPAAAKVKYKNLARVCGIKALPLSALVGDQVAEKHFRDLRERKMRKIRKRNLKLHPTRRKQVIPRGTPGIADRHTLPGQMDEFYNYQPSPCRLLVLLPAWHVCVFIERE